MKRGFEEWELAQYGFVGSECDCLFADEESGYGACEITSTMFVRMVDG